MDEIADSICRTGVRLPRFSAPILPIRKFDFKIKYSSFVKTPRQPSFVKTPRQPDIRR
jgi:hypothetical protein